jgi:hypothetical protein
MKLTKLTLLEIVNSQISQPDGTKFQLADIFVSGHDPDKNFRLTRQGRDLLSTILTAYNIKLSGYTYLTGNQILTIGRYMKSPYYLGSRGNLVVFEEIIASEFILLGADLNLWINMRSFQN